jgi:hypothetical protein
MDGASTTIAARRHDLPDRTPLTRVSRRNVAVPREGDLSGRKSEMDAK